MWLVGTATVTTQGLTARYDTTNEEWGLLSGQNRGPRLGHQWGLFHGHGHRDAEAILHLLEAEHTAPEAVRYNVIVRELIRDLLTRAGRAQSGALTDMAVRAGVLE
jgi:hypothetical protein